MSSCSNWGQDSAPDRITYSPYGAYINSSGKVVAPKNAPPQIKRAIAAANRISNYPYKRGGGHKKHYDNAYDCSGSVSFVLKEAGLTTQTRHSSLFLKYGSRGAGKWITVYAKSGHVFMTICGIRFDTGGGDGQRDRGPKWHTTSRSGRGFIMRHPAYL